MIALATSIISASVIVALSALTACKMIRQLAWTYPSFGSIRSMVAAIGLGPIPAAPIKNGSFVTSQKPVHLDCAHALVRSKGNPFFFARNFAESISVDHGVFSRVS